MHCLLNTSYAYQRSPHLWRVLSEQHRACHEQPCAANVKVVEFDRVPADPLVGDDFCKIEELQRTKMICGYQVLRVQGRVMWKGHGSNNVKAELTLRCENPTSYCEPKQLFLTKYTRRSSSNKAETVEIDYQPDAENPFWGTGAKGEFVSYCHFRGRVRHNLGVSTRHTHTVRRIPEVMLSCGRGRFRAHIASDARAVNDQIDGTFQ